MKPFQSWVVIFETTVLASLFVSQPVAVTHIGNSRSKSQGVLHKPFHPHGDWACSSEPFLFSSNTEPLNRALSKGPCFLRPKVGDISYPPPTHSPLTTLGRAPSSPKTQPYLAWPFPGRCGWPAERASSARLPTAAFCTGSSGPPPVI